MFYALDENFHMVILALQMFKHNCEFPLKILLKGLYKQMNKLNDLNIGEQNKINFDGCSLGKRTRNGGKGKYGGNKTRDKGRCIQSSSMSTICINQAWS